MPEDDQKAERGNSAADPEDVSIPDPKPTGMSSGCSDCTPEPSVPDQASASRPGGPQEPGEPASEESAGGADTPRQQDSTDDPAGPAVNLTRSRPKIEQSNADTAPPDGERVTFRGRAGSVLQVRLIRQSKVVALDLTQPGVLVTGGVTTFRLGPGSWSPNAGDRCTVSDRDLKSAACPRLATICWRVVGGWGCASRAQ